MIYYSKNTENTFSEIHPVLRIAIGITFITFWKSNFESTIHADFIGREYFSEINERILMNTDSQLK